jgi:ABC-type glycerol-3-phosphate transport system substrate-binding protein
MKKRLMLVMAVLLAILLITAGCQHLPDELNNLFKTNEPPKAYIDSISPTEAIPGETVTFLGHGTDSDGTIVAYRWHSNLDGEIGVKDYFQTASLSSGQHIINFKVQDNNGEWSEEISYTIVIEGDSGSLPIITYFNATSNSKRQLDDNSLGNGKCNICYHSTGYRYRRTNRI